VSLHRDVHRALAFVGAYRSGTVDELDQVYTLVEDLTDATRRRRRIQLLDGLRMSLCTAIDGF